MFSVPERWKPMVRDEMKELKVFQSCASLMSSATYLVSPPYSWTFISEWIHHAQLSMELPVLYRIYNLHTIIQLEEMNFATTK